MQVGNLKALATKMDIPPIQLTDDFAAKIPDLGAPYSTLLTAGGLKDVAEYATGVGPYKNTLYGVDAKTNLLTKSTGVAELIHAAGLQVRQG
jgi:glycerophosphoryl diester phosphodiesterase